MTNSRNLHNFERLAADAHGNASSEGRNHHRVEKPRRERQPDNVEEERPQEIEPATPKPSGQESDDAAVQGPRGPEGDAICTRGPPRRET